MEIFSVNKSSKKKKKTINRNSVLLEKLLCRESRPLNF